MTKNYWQLQKPYQSRDNICWTQQNHLKSGQIMRTSSISENLTVVVTTRHEVQQLHKHIKLSVGNQVGKITRELDKKSLLNQSSIYTKYTWSMLQPHVHLIFYSRPPCSRPMMSHNVTCHVPLHHPKEKEKKKKINIKSEK